MRDYCQDELHWEANIVSSGDWRLRMKAYKLIASGEFLTDISSTHRAVYWEMATNEKCGSFREEALSSLVSELPAWSELMRTY